MQPPFNAPDDPGREPTMDGFVLDYVNTFRSEMGRLPEYDEYAQIMSGLHARAGTGDLNHRQGVRDLRPLVLRGALADVHEPVLLPRGQRLRSRGQRPLRQLPAPERRRDDLRAARCRRALLACLRRPRHAVLDHRDDPHAPALQAVRDPLLDPRRLLRRRRAGEAAHLLVHRAEPAARAQRLPPRHERDLARPLGGPTLVDPGRGGAARPHLLRDPRLLHRGRVELRQHPVPGRLRRARRHLRPRPAAARPPPDPAAPAGQMGFRFDRSGVRIPTLAVSAYIDPQHRRDRASTATPP